MSQVGKILSLFLRVDLLIPLLLIIAYLGLVLIAKGVVPTSEELITTFAKLYSSFGYEIVFVSAFLESLAIVTYFVPGSFALALGVIFARTGQTELTTVILVALAGATLGYQLDYFLGRFGFGEILTKIGYHNLLQSTKSQLARFGQKGMVVGFIHANFGSLLSLAAGATNFPWLRFTLVSTSSTLFWAVIWSLIIYSLGELFLELFKRYSFLFLILFITTLVLINLPTGGKKR